MRIAIFSDIYKPSINGVVNHIILLKKYLEAWGEQVYLFVPGTGAPEDDDANVIRIPGIPIADTGYHLSVRLNQRSKELLPQIDVIHVHHPFISGSLGLYCTGKYKMPLLFTNHTRYDLYAKAYLPLLPSTLSESALQTFFHSFSQRCAALIAPSPSIAEVMKQWGVHNHIAVIPNGIELERFQSPARIITRHQLGIPKDAVVAVYVGRMSPEKSLDRLLQIFCQLLTEEPHTYLLLVGGGPELNPLRRLAHELSIAHRTIFTDAVAYETVPDYLALADFFVSTSVTEVHPLTLIEAAASGLPALGIDSAGVEDMIQDGTTGYLAPDNDLGFGLRFLRLAKDPDLRRRMGLQAEKFSLNFSAHTNAQRILKLYEDLHATYAPAITRK